MTYFTYYFSIANLKKIVAYYTLNHGAYPIRFYDLIGHKIKIKRSYFDEEIYGVFANCVGKKIILTDVVVVERSGSHRKLDWLWIASSSFLIVEPVADEIFQSLLHPNDVETVPPVKITDDNIFLL